MTALATIVAALYERRWLAATDAQFLKWLMEPQKEAGVFTTVSTLVDRLSDNPAAKLTAQQIIERVQRSQQQRRAA